MMIMAYLMAEEYLKPCQVSQMMIHTENLGIINTVQPGIFRHVQEHSAIFSHVQQYLRTLRHIEPYSDLFGTLFNPYSNIRPHSELWYI